MEFRFATAIVVMTVMVLGGCSRPQSSNGVPAGAGRYLGIGVYSPGPLWAKMVARPPKDAAVAKLADDDEIIVVVDSHTGEIRQCGNLSGYCIRMNPWAQAGGVPPSAPMNLTVHAIEPESTPVVAPSPAKQAEH